MSKTQRYNIALLAENPSPYTRIANDLFSENYNTYILSENSLAHITVCQFETDNTKLLKDIFTEISTHKMHHYTPNMIGVHFNKGFKENQGFYMAQILIEPEKNLSELHYQVLAILKKYPVNCLGAIREQYLPHLTLARIKLIHPISIWPEHLFDPASFKLTLGLSDSNGQYLKMLYSV